MSLSGIGLLGIQAVSTGLQVTGNNIVNVGTTGFKSSRADFSDIFFSGGVQSTTATQTGDGVKVAKITQEFKPGVIESTGRQFDFALEGEGFFTVVDATGNTFYSRAGGMVLNGDGNLEVIGSGAKLKGYNSSLNATSGLYQLDAGISTLVIDPPGSLQAKPTSTVNFGSNLDASESIPTTAFNSTDSTSYNSVISSVSYDSLGSSHTSNVYLVKSGTNTWRAYFKLNSATAATSTNAAYVDLTFSAAGALTTIANATVNGSGQTIATNGTSTVTWGAVAPGTGASNISEVITISDITQRFSNFDQGFPSQNGFSAGTFTRLSYDADGNIFAVYSNNQKAIMGQFGIAKFANDDGLGTEGSNLWSASVDSGEAVIQNAGEKPVAEVQNGSLEQSNVDLTEELVDLITLQRYFQANAKTITTDNQLLQQIIAIR